LARVVVAAARIYTRAKKVYVHLELGGYLRKNERHVIGVDCEGSHKQIIGVFRAG